MKYWRRLKEKKFIRFLCVMYKKIRYDRIDVYAAQAGFYLIMSAAPIIMLMFTLLKFTPLTQEVVMDALAHIVNENIMMAVNEVVGSVYDGSTVTLISFATLSLLWVSGKGILGMMNGINHIYRIRENRNYFYRRFNASLYTVLLVVAFLLAAAILVFGVRFQEYIGSVLPFFARHDRVLIYGQMLLALCMLTIIFMALYVFLPDRKKSFFSQFPGAVFATLSWSVFSYLFSIYLGLAKNMSVIYGGLVTLVVSLLWLYACMYLWFIGAELNAYMESRESFEFLYSVEVEGKNPFSRS